MNAKGGDGVNEPYVVSTERILVLAETFEDYKKYLRRMGEPRYSVRHRYVGDYADAFLHFVGMPPFIDKISVIIYCNNNTDPRTKSPKLLEAFLALANNLPDCPVEEVYDA